MSWLETVPGMVAEPNIAADVANVFTNKVQALAEFASFEAFVLTIS